MSLFETSHFCDAYHKQAFKKTYYAFWLYHAKLLRFLALLVGRLAAFGFVELRPFEVE